MREYTSLIYQITSVNRAWKQARERWGEESPTALMLRKRKSSLQARLIRDHRSSVYLKADHDNTEGEPLYSVRLIEPVRLPNNMTRNDAEHLPVRLAEELFSQAELSELVKQGNRYDV